MRRSAKMKLIYFVLMAIIICLFVNSCTCNNSFENKSAHNRPTLDTTASMMTEDSVIIQKDSATVAIRIDRSNHHKGRKPASVAKEEIPKGTAIVYCPVKMIRGIQSIVNAVISKDELSKAYTNFAEKIHQQNPGLNKETIARDIKGDSIDLYEKMGVTLEFDPEDFAQITKDRNPTKEFKNKNTLEWEWIIKPIHSTQKSILSFKFYYVDPDNKENYILEKTISVSATVDARSYIDRWKDFLADDPKTTITTILVPLVTFISGFFTGKRRKN